MTIKRTKLSSVLYPRQFAIREPRQTGKTQFERDCYRIGVLLLIDVNSDKIAGTIRRDGICDHNGNHFED